MGIFKMKLTKKQRGIVIDCLKANATFLELANRLQTTVVKASRILNALSLEDKRYGDAFFRHKWPTNINKGFIFLGSYQTAKGETQTKVKTIRDENDNFIRFEQYKVNTGGSLLEGERAGLLRPGDYVLKGDWENSRYAEIFLPHRVEETLYEFYTLSFISTKNKNGRKEKLKYTVLNNIAESMISRGISENDLELKKIRAAIKKVFARNLKKRTEKWLSAREIENGALEEFKVAPWFCQYKRKTYKTRVVYYLGKSLGSVDKRQIKSVLTY